MVEQYTALAIATTVWTVRKREDIMKNFNLTESEVQTQLAVLRHCELVKGCKEGDRIYLVPFS